MRSRAFGVVAVLAFSASCGSTGADSPTTPSNVTTSNPVTMAVAGRGDFKPLRYTAELSVRGTTAYTTTWGNAVASSSAFYIWDVSANVPKLVDSVIVAGVGTLGDVAVSDDGSTLVVATERGAGAIYIYSLADPRKPVLMRSFSTPHTSPGVHTAEIGRVNGKLYGFLSIDPGGGTPAALVIVDLSTPAQPQEILWRFIGTPFVHDTFVRDGLLFLALWDDGVAIWDIGGGGKGGSPSAPVELGHVRTAGGEVHNIWWLKDPVTGSARYAFIGQEVPGAFGVASSGDVHVVDIGTMSAPKEVAFYTSGEAGTHNFSVDEANGILYAAYYNGGVRALDVRGDLGTCTDAQRSVPLGSSAILCDLRKMGRELGIGLLDQGTPVYVWGVQYLDGAVYASDMINGIWKLRPVSRP
ncbi:MAG: hypothetical protein ABJE47_02615 [bacterium]